MPTLKYGLGPHHGLLLSSSSRATHCVVELRRSHDALSTNVVSSGIDRLGNAPPRCCFTSFPAPPPLPLTGVVAARWRRCWSRTAILSAAVAAVAALLRRRALPRAPPHAAERRCNVAAPAAFGELLRVVLVRGDSARAYAAVRATVPEPLPRHRFALPPLLPPLPLLLRAVRAASRHPPPRPLAGWTPVSLEPPSVAPASPANRHSRRWSAASSSSSLPDGFYLSLSVAILAQGHTPILLCRAGLLRDKLGSSVTSWAPPRPPSK
ncbi:hypothetical protein Scep_022410 [Stephania cephalantha]|uniref:Uncharacterized protein n=1 Tax=Stephania cephalantha TaxID=152367 RepID=A0AAP0F6B6_9MAGN